MTAVVFVALIAASVTGFILGRHASEKKKSPQGEWAVGIAEGGILGLVGLILGFSFSIAVSRFDARQTFVVQEANAIGTTYLRSSFLEQPARKQFRSLLRDYTTLRVDYYTRYYDVQNRQRQAARTNVLQDQLWTIASDAARRDPHSLPLSLLIQTTNDTIDISAEQTAILNNHVPGSMLLLVALIAISGAALIGYGFGLSGTRNWGIAFVFATLVTCVVFIIIDLDRPQRGTIRINLTPLVTQAQQMTGD